MVRIMRRRSIEAGRALRLRKPTPPRLLASEASPGLQTADTCLQTHGGFGFAEEYDVERKFRETRLYQVAPISTNLILILRQRTMCWGCPGHI